MINNRRIKMYKYAKVFKRCIRKGGARHAREKTGNIEERPQRKESDKPQTGYRHWTFGSQKTRQEGTQEKINIKIGAGPFIYESLKQLIQWDR